MDQLPYSAAGGSLTYNHALALCGDDTGRNLYIIEYCPRKDNTVVVSIFKAMVLIISAVGVVVGFGRSPVVT